MNLRKHTCKILMFVWLLGMPAAMAAPIDDFRAANQLYDAEKFAEAAAAYEKIEPKTAHVYYNLGNAWFRQNKLGPAVLNYERARKLAPRDPDILANLKFAQQRLGVDEVNTPPRAVQRFLRAVIGSRTTTEWSAYELAALWLSVLAIGAWVYFPRMRTGLLVMAVAGLAGFAVSTFALSYQVINDHTAPEAVLVANGAEARFAPIPDSTIHFRLAEGTEVVIREDRGQWVLVERADGQQGWVKSEAVDRIESAVTR
ncbi:MAG TPA: SH3 domain-containing protein [Verrucomicrobiae bacterium]|nr:SH3 domain-containing protein [Verrucomicrobiae bacterium]